MRWIMAFVLTIGAAFPAAAKIIVACPWVRATLPHQDTAAAYMTLTSPAGDTLTGVDAQEAGMVMLHETRVVNGVEQMNDLEQLKLKPNMPLALEPGRIHLMLMDLKQPIVAGGTLHISLHFVKDGDVAVAAPVLPANAPGRCQ